MTANIKPDVVVDVINKNCPVPLIEMRKAVMKAEEGDVIEVKGTHEASQFEIPMAVESMGFHLLSSKKGRDGVWHIFIKK
jgi:tRNA 2-thiouridine synthesizing protein A